MWPEEKQRYEEFKNCWTKVQESYNNNEEVAPDACKAETIMWV